MCEQLQYTIFKNKELYTFGLNIQYAFTMIDGKVINSIVDNQSTLRCPVCKLTKKDYINNLPRFVFT